MSEQPVQQADIKMNDEPVLREDFTVSGSKLVEASAGTGKTHTIESLYLRLVAVNKYTAQQILVVTFTEAAAKELRDRIRNALAGMAGQQGEDDNRVKAILGLAPENDRENVKSRVRRALLDFDEAAIYTIHGFCRRVLQRYAVECGAALDSELVPDTDGLISAACQDWWRRNAYAAGQDRALLLKKIKCDIGTLLECVKKHLAKPDAEWRPKFFTGKTFAGVIMDVENRLALIDSEAMRNFIVACENLKTLVGNAQARGFKWENERIVHTAIDKSNPGRLMQCFNDVRAKWEGDGKGIPAARAEWDKLKQGLPNAPDDSGIVGALNRLSSWLRKPGQDPGFIRRLKDVPNLDNNDNRLATLPQALALDKAIQVAAIEEIKADYQKTKRAAHIITFDDLLLDLRRALTRGGENDRKRILDAIRAEYKIALIDEFQDTDPVQYEIFRTVFQGDWPLFLVGDPKQAIYSFRSGDIFTYKAAQAAVEPGNRIHLDTNYRSESNLVAAINRLFRDRGGENGKRHTFLHGDWIEYPGDLKAKGVEPGKSLYTDGKSDPAPFRLWYYPAGNDEENIYSDVADEIVGILNDENQTFGLSPSKREIRPADIAVLVHTHGDADTIARKLLRRRVPVVRQKMGNVFDTPEAADMALLLAAMAEPRDAVRVRSALACRAMALETEELKSLVAGGAILVRPAAGGNKQGAEQWMMEDWIEFFDELRETWARNSFIEAFNRLTRTVGLRARAVKAEAGERRLTNLLHLADLIHCAAARGRLSIEATLTWLARQRNEDTRDVSDDEYEMRLETDEDAVKIMTIFKSKGLQFPIVFVPTLWRKTPKQSLHAGQGRVITLEYHENGQDPAGPQDRLVVNLDAKDGEARKKHLEERLAEDVRLLYVACTRAINRTYAVWNDLGEKNNDSALACVLGAAEHGDPNIPKIEALRNYLKNGLAANTELAIAIETPNTSGLENPPCYQPRRAEEHLELQTEDRRSNKEPVVNKKYGHTSFSSLAPRDLETVPDMDSTKDHDESDGAGKDSGADPATGGKAELSILTFPAGARTGTCWHRIFEELDFKTDDKQVREVVNEHLATFRLDKGSAEISGRKRELVAAMVRSTLELPLPIVPGKSAAGTFALQDIDSAKRRAELEFHFSLPDREQSTTAILELLKKHWETASDDGKRQFLQILEKNWDREIPRGFMTGSIDLFFEHNGGYYIVDWKSNRRTGILDDFDAKGLRDEMTKHAYYLQYLFYTVAVHNYLRGCKKGYDYKKHFGGVFYIFLRGTQNTDTHGIYADRPGYELIADLSAILVLIRNQNQPATAG